MREIPAWRAYFWGLLEGIAARSPDPDTQVGCILVGTAHQILSTGYNGFPRGVEPTLKRLERPEKYSWMEHAERNAIYNAARHGVALEDASLFIGMAPCVDCARAIVQSGIKFVWIEDSTLGRDRWAESMDKAFEILNEGGVETWAGKFE